jgi:hypothetical protein
LVPVQAVLGYAGGEAKIAKIPIRFIIIKPVIPEGWLICRTVRR